ncbi:MAG: hypothetical protein V1779_01205 [bacterium]
MRRVIILILIYLVANENAISQCGCLGGAAVGGLTPIGGTANVGLLRTDYFRASLFYSYAYGDKFYRGDNRAEKDIVDHYETQFSALLLGYGLTQDITIEAELGYFPKKLQDFETNDATGSGLSHTTLYAKYNVFNSIVNEIEFTFGAGTKLPLELKKENIPQHVRASTGAYGLIFQAFLHKGFKKQDMHIFLINRSEYNFVNQNDYQYGPSFNTSLYFTRGITKSLTGILELRNELRLKDKINGKIHEDSGGMFFHLSPQINYTLGQFNFAVLFDYPFYQYYNGYQLGNNFSAALNVTWQTKF